MVFSSLVFLLGFLPALLLVYFLIPARFRGLRNLVLLAFSLFFYFAGGPRHLPLMLLSIAVNYVGGLLCGKRRSLFLYRFFAAGLLAVLGNALCQPFAAVQGGPGDSLRRRDSGVRSAFFQRSGLPVLAVLLFFCCEPPRALTGAQPRSAHRCARDARFVRRVNRLACWFLFGFYHATLPPSQIGDKLFEVSSNGYQMVVKIVLYLINIDKNGTEIPIPFPAAQGHARAIARPQADNKQGFVP